MKRNASSENFVQTVMRCLAILPPYFIKTLYLLTATPAPFGGLVQYLVAKTRYEPDAFTPHFTLTARLQRELAILEGDILSCRRFELFVRTLDKREAIPSKAGDVVFRTVHGLLRERDDGPCLIRRLRVVARDEIASVPALEKDYGLRMNGARAYAAASNGSMTAFRRFASRLSKTDIASIAQEAARHSWTEAFDHLVTTGIMKKLGKDSLVRVAGVALLSQSLETLGVLMDCFDVNHSPTRMSLLQRAVQNDREDITRLLLSKGASPETRSWGGNLLHWAHDVGVCRALVEAGADIENRDPEDDTPLLSAVKARAAEAVAYLIDHGADVLAQDAEGLDSFDVAARNGDRPTLEIFQSRGLFEDRILDFWASEPCALNR